MGTSSKKLSTRDKMDKAIETFFDYCICADWSFAHIGSQVMSKYNVDRRFALIAHGAAKSISAGTPSDRALREAVDKLSKTIGNPKLT